MKRLSTIAIILALTIPVEASFRGFLKKSTAVTIKFGPIVDATDGYTPETSLTAHAAHIRLSKNGGDFAAKNSATVPAHDENGYWDVALDTTDSDTMGILTVGWTDANSVVITPQEYGVLDPNLYNTLFSTGELNVYSFAGLKIAQKPMVDVNQIYGDPVPSSADLRAQIRYQLAATIAPADANINSLVLAVYELAHAIVAQPGTTVAAVTDASTFTITAGSTADDYYNQAVIVVEDVSDSNRRASRIVRDYTGVSKTVKTDEALPFLPAAADPVYIYLNRAVGRGRVSP
jgi:hypothetical protein